MMNHCHDFTCLYDKYLQQYMVFSIFTSCTNVQLFTDQIFFVQLVHHITNILKILACQEQVLPGSSKTVLQPSRCITVFAFPFNCSCKIFIHIYISNNQGLH